MAKNKILQDLGVEVDTPEQALWKRVKANAEELIKGSEETALVNKEIVKLADLKIKGD